MNNSQATLAKVVNYTPEMEQIIRDSAPLNLDIAKALGVELGKSTKSIIAKAISLEVEYIVKAPAPKRLGVVTKAELVTMISKKLSSDFDLSGLAKAPASALKALQDAINHYELISVKE